MRFVVGYAADAQGQEALELAAWLAERMDASLTIAYVVPAEFPIATHVDLRSPFPPEFQAQVDEWLARAEAWIQAHTNLASATHVVSSASPARGLVELAQEQGAALIVLGSSRRSRARHFRIGSVSGQLMHFAPMPLALAPSGFEVRPDVPLGRVWCGYLDTAQSRDALASAQRIARRLDAPLRLVNFAIPDGVTHLPAADVEQIVRRRHQEAEANLEQGLHEVDPDLKADAMVAEGTSIEAVFATLAAASDEDILVLGSSAAGQLTRVFFGGTASRLLRESPWPVIAVPLGGTSAADESAARR